MIEGKALYWSGVIIGLLVLLAVFPPLALLAGGGLAIMYSRKRRARRRPQATPGWTSDQINRMYFQ